MKTKSVDLVGSLYDTTQIVTQKLEQVFSESLGIGQIENKTQGFPSRKLEENRFITPIPLKLESQIDKLKIDKTKLESITSGYTALVIPKEILEKLVLKTRVVLLHPTQDNKYVPPKDTWDKMKARRNSQGYLKDKLIKYVSLQEIYPNGQIRSFGSVGKHIDFLEITLPAIPPSTQKAMEEVYQSIPKDFGGQWVTLADPRCLGVTIHTAQKKPSPPLPPREVDPGLVYIYGAYAIVFPETFYHLSKMEKGFLRIVRNIAEKWDSRSFVQSQLN